MTGAKGSNASKGSSKPSGGQQSLFHFYKKKEQTERTTGVGKPRVTDDQTSSSELVPVRSNKGFGPQPLSPKEGIGGLSSNFLEANKKHHGAFEKQIISPVEGVNPNIAQSLPESEMAWMPSRSPAAGNEGDMEVGGGLGSRLRSPVPIHLASAAPGGPVGFELNIPSAEERDTKFSSKLLPREPFPIFKRTLPRPTHQPVAAGEDKHLSDLRAPSLQGLPTTSNVQKATQGGAAFQDIVDLTGPEPHDKLLQSAFTSSTTGQRSTVIIDNDFDPVAPPRGSQDAPIDLSSSPPADRQPINTLRPFFAHRTVKRKERNDVGFPSSIGSTSHQLVVPWPDAEAQHSRGPQSRFWPSGSPSFAKCQPTTSSIGFTYQSSLRFLDNGAIPQFLLSENEAARLSLHAPTSLEREDAVSSLPNSHREHPGIARLLDEPVDVKPSHTVDNRETWTHRWRPRRAAEVLGNEDKAHYLEAWLHALEIRTNEQFQMSEDRPKEKDQTAGPSGNRGTKRPNIVRIVDKKRGRKRRRVESDDDSSLADWMVEEMKEVESENTTDDEPLIPREKGSVSSPPPAQSLDVLEDDPLSHREDCQPEFSQLTNTILLAGPPGSGKTSTIYACAEELGWEVFEVYPGIGKRSGGNISSLVGDVGKNHIVGRGGASGTSTKRHSIQSSLQPGFGYLAEESQNDATGFDDGMRAVRQSIILLEEVDILFKEDANFWPTVVNIIKTSHRPVLMTCNDISLVPCDDLPLQTCLVFQPCPAPLAVSFLQCVCLAEGRLIPRKQLEAMYATTYEPISPDEPDEPQIPFSSHSRACPDLRRVLNNLQFLCRGEVEETHKEEMTSLTDLTTSSSTEVLADWSQPLDVVHGGSPGRDISRVYDIYQMWKHSEYTSFTDGYLERCSSDAMEALSIDRYGPSADDEIGHALLDKFAVDGRSSGLAFYNRDETIAREALGTSRHVLESSGVGPRTRASVHQRGATLDCRSLVRGRVANQIQIVAFLDDLIPLSAPLLPRPPAILEYAPFVRHMVTADDALETESTAGAEMQTQNKRGRSRRYRLQDEYVRYLTLSREGLEAARKTVLS